MIQQIKQSTVKCLHDTDGGDKKYKRKRKKVQILADLGIVSKRTVFEL